MTETLQATLHQGDCLEVMRQMSDDSVDAVVTDPPYGLSFFFSHWDRGIPGEAFWREALRVAKPGAHLLAFGGTRTYHRLTCAIEDAGWEIRDCLMWVYGGGFPKSHDISKAIDKAAGAERDVLGYRDTFTGQGRTGSANYSPGDRIVPITAPATPEATQWSGWGTALKPAWEPVILARKPPIGTVAQNILAYGTGGINVDGCRIEGESVKVDDTKPGDTTSGRWPANVIHDGSDEVVSHLPERKVAAPGKPSNGKPIPPSLIQFNSYRKSNFCYPGSGSAARFFKACPDTDPEDAQSRLIYCPKASPRDRAEGLDKPNIHPTVKPTSLMRYLCRLITPPGGIVLDPFMGSGSTGKAAILENFRFIGIEKEPEYLEIAKARISHVQPTPEPAPEPTIEGRVAWLETQTKALTAKVKRMESGQLSLFDHQQTG